MDRFLLPTLLSLALAVPAALSAADVPFKAPKDVAGGTVSGISALDAGDLDGDGRADVVVVEGGKHASGRKTFAWFRAPSDPQGSWSRHEINTSAPLRSFLGTVKLADFDGDGDLDLVVSSDNHSGSSKQCDIYVFVNPLPTKAATTTWAYHRVTPSTQPWHHVNDMEVADMDGDGKLDIVCRSLDPNEIHIFFNNSISSWTRKSIATGLSASEGLAIGHLDNDGKPDIAYTGFWLKSPSNPRTQNYTKRNIDSDYHTINQNTKSAIGDIDGDGANDIVIGPAESFRNGGNHVLAWYKNPNDGSSSNWTRHVIKSNTNHMHQVKLADMDGDGDLDVVTGQPWGPKDIIIWHNDGSGGFGSSQLVADNKGLYASAIIDVDGDGDLDIVGNDSYAGSSKPWLYQSELNDGGDPPPPVDTTPPARDAFARIEAESFDARQGIGIYNGGSGQKIGSIEDGTWARFDGVDFGSGGVASIVARVSSKNSGGTIEYRLGSTTGALLGTTEVPGTGGWNTFTTITSATQASTSGSKTLFLVFRGGGGALLDVDWFHFETGTVTPPNQAPDASFTVSTSDLTASLDAAGSSDPDGDGLSYSWNFGDGSGGSGQTTSHSYAAGGSYTVTLTVSDGELSDSASKLVTVDEPATPPIGVVGTWLLTNVGQSGQSLNAAGSANRANVDAEATDPSDDTQLFEVQESNQAGWYTIIGVASGLAVECWQSSPGDGDSVSLYSTNGKDWQKWRFELQADGGYVIIGKYNQRPMTLEGGDVVCRAAAGLATQRWTLVDPSGATPPPPPPPSNTAPVASFSASTSGLSVSVDAGGSSDPDGEALGYSWSFGDGAVATGATASHSYASGGSYTVRLTVSDGDLSDSTTRTVTVEQPAPTPGGLIAHWTLDDGAGTLAADSVGVHDGQLKNGPSWTGGQIDGGLAFDGANDHVDVGALDVAGPAITVAAWIRPDRLDGLHAEGRILSQATGITGSEHVVMLSPYPMGSGGIGVRFRLKVGGSTHTLIASGGGLSAGTWAHVAATYDGSRMVVYQDGVEVGSTGVTGSITGSSSVPLWLGGNPSGATDRPFDGVIDDVRIYDQALDAAEIQGLLDGDPPPTSVGALPAPWSAQDVGAVAAAGSAEYDAGSERFTVTGSGADIWYGSDEFHFVHQEIEGDLVVEARVASNEAADGWAKAGVMIRDSLQPEAKSALMCVTAGKGSSFDWRLSTGGGTSKDYPGDGASAPLWVRIERSGSTVTGYISSDGLRWTEIGVRSIAFSGPVEVGLAVTAHDDGELCTASFEQVDVLPMGGG